MEITLNNRPEIFDNEYLTVTQLLKEMKFTFKIITVKHNGHFIKKEDYDTTIIRHGDVVAAIHMITGG